MRWFSANFLLTLSAATSVTAQGLPAYRPLNPVIASRSALGFDPIGRNGSGWQTAIRLDYGNVLEAQTRASADYLFDAELVRVGLTLGRRIGRWNLQGELPVESAQSGALDPFISWWHGVFGFREGRREERPENEYTYFIDLPDTTVVSRPLPGTALGDLRLTAGFNHNPNWMTTFVAVLPTNNRPSGWGLETVAFGVETAVRATVVENRVEWTGSAGLGYTPKAGSLERWQREFFASASSGFRLRFWGRQSAYANLFFHSGPFGETSLSGLGGPDLSLDFGFLLQPGAGPEILAGMVEDLYPYGPAVDLILRVGLRW